MSTPSPTEDRPAWMLVGRQASHFTRMARIVAAELGVPLELRANRDLLSLDPADYGGHPALRLPVLLRADEPVYGCLNICRVIARASGREHELVFPEHDLQAELLNAGEVVLNAMALQTELVIHEVVAKRTPDAVSGKRRQGLIRSLAWLELRLDAVLAQLPESRRTSLLEVALFCLMEHIPYRNPMDLSPYRALQDFTRQFGQRPSALATPYGFDAPRPQ
jgi:glutathione S-transferase